MTQNNKPETDNAMCLVRRDDLDGMHYALAMQTDYLEYNPEINDRLKQALAGSSVKQSELCSVDCSSKHTANPVQGWRTDFENIPLGVEVMVYGQLSLHDCGQKDECYLWHIVRRSTYKGNLFNVFADTVENPKMWMFRPKSIQGDL